LKGNTSWAFSEDVATRFIAYGWNVTRVGDANDIDMLMRALGTFQRSQDRPTLIIVDSHIRLWRSQQTGHQRGRTASRSVTKRSNLPSATMDGPRDAKFWSRKECTSISMRE